MSCLLCYLMTFVLLAKPTELICGIRRMGSQLTTFFVCTCLLEGIGFAFSCLYAALLVKTNRIHRIFSQVCLSILPNHFNSPKATRTRRPPPMISPISQLALTSAFVGSKLIFTMCWLIVQTPGKSIGTKQYPHSRKGTQHIYPTRAEVVLACNVPDHHFLYSLAYEALLLIMCTIYAVKTRKVPENFNETRYIGFSMFAILGISKAFCCKTIGTRLVCSGPV